MSSFFRNVFSTAATSKQVQAEADLSKPDPAPQIDSMFAGLNLKPRLPDPDPEPANANRPESPQPSAFSFLQPSSSSFSFISEEPLERATSEQLPEPVPSKGEEGLVKAINQRHASEPIHSSYMDGNNHIPDEIINATSESDHYRALSGDQESVSASDHNVVDAEGPGSWQSQLDRFLAVLSARMIQYWTTMNALDESHCHYENRCSELLQNLSEINGDVEALKIAQSKAVEDEAYDRADELDGKISQLQINISEIEEQLKIAADGKQHVFEQRRDQVEQLQPALESIFNELIQLKETCRTETEETVELKMSQLNDKLEHLKEESVRIDKILAIIDADLDRIRNEDEEIRSAISEKTKDVQQEKEAIFSELKSIDEELVRLREQIRLKEEEQARLREALSEVDQKISQAGAAFDRQLMRIENQRLRIEADRADILKDQAELQHSQMELNTERDLIATLQQSSTELASSIDEIVSSRKLQLEKVLLDEKLYDELHDRRRECEQILSAAQLRLAEQDRKSRLLSKQKVSLEEEIRRQESLIAEIDQQVPELEASKANAVTSRDFKTAGILAKQLKQLVSSRSDSVELSEKLKKDLDSIHQSVLDHEAPLREARLQFESADVELDRLKFEHLCKQLASLRSSESGAVDDELTIIQAQIDKLTSSAQLLSEKHGWTITDDHSSSPIHSPARSPERHRSPSPSACSSGKQSPRASSPKHITSNGNHLVEDIPPSQRLTEIDMTVESLEQQLEQAITNDDFDEADKIQSNINDLNVEKEAILRNHPNLDDINMLSQEDNQDGSADDRSPSVSPERQPKLESNDVKEERNELPGELVDE